MKNRIRDLRRDRGMTMKELGAILGVSESAISQYETGKRQPDNETLLRLSEFFGATVGYILGVEEQKPPEALSDERFAELFNDLDARDQDTVLRLMQSMIDARSER